MKYKILVVDDSIESLQVIVNFIQRSNPDYTIYQSKSSIEAVKIAQKTLPDLIITDWDMPEMDGIELISVLKADEKTKDIPIIMATGVMITSDNLKLALEAGAFDYIRKPVDPIELTARIHSAITIRQYHQENLQKKNRELAENALYLVKNNEFILEIKKKLDDFSDYVHLKDEAKVILAHIKEDIDEKIKSDSWERFNLAFQAVHPHFYSNLLSGFQSLTPNDLKLCAFIRMGMSSKNIASVLYISPDSIKVARSRLRKKMKLDQSQNLESFLAAF